MPRFNIISMKIDLQQINEKLDEYARCKTNLNNLKKWFLSFDNGVFAWNKYSSQIKHAGELRQITLTKRDMNVWYIVGSGGSGKTTTAKFFAEKLGYNYFVSGGGDDILDGYDSEECIILDDYRASVMRFNEFLKFIDNHTNSSISSRYFNKDISKCKLIIITSVVPPEKLYNITKADDESQDFKEPLEQLLRRIQHRVLKITESGKVLELSNYKDEIKNEITELFDMKIVFKYFGIDINKKDVSTLYSTLMNDITENKYEENFNKRQRPIF